MIELLTWATPNESRPAIMLEEVGLPYTVRLVDITAGEQFSPDFLTISPNNKIPAVIGSDEAGKRRVLFESGAILIYLAEKTGLLLATGGQRRAEALSWLFWAMSGPAIGRFLRHVSTQTGQSDKNPFEHETIRLMRVLEKRLNEAPSLAGAYSIADIAAFPWLKFAFPVIKTRLHEGLGVTPGIDGWLKEINPGTPCSAACARPKL